MRRYVLLLIYTTLLHATALHAQTKIMEVEVYYISPGAQKDSQLEELVYRLLVAAEIKINNEVLSPPARFDFRIIKIEPWDPLGLITYKMKGVGTLVSYPDILSRIHLPHNRLPANRFYLILTRRHIGVWSKKDKRAYQAFGAIDLNDHYRVLVSDCGNRSLPGLVSSFLHELGHMAELPDRRDSGCKKTADIMCRNSKERELRPVFNIRYQKSFYAYVWFLRARNQ